MNSKKCKRLEFFLLVFSLRCVQIRKDLFLMYQFTLSSQNHLSTPLSIVRSEWITLQISSRSTIVSANVFQDWSCGNENTENLNFEVFQTAIVSISVPLSWVSSKNICFRLHKGKIVDENICTVCRAYRKFMFTGMNRILINSDPAGHGQASDRNYSGNNQ